MLSKRENALLALKGEKTEYTPCWFDSCQMVPIGLALDTPPEMGKTGVDGFGVHQTATASAGGMWTPTPTVPPILTDVTEWKNIINIPDVTNVPWDAVAVGTTAGMHLDPANYVQDAFNPNGIFERLHFLMGFENAMCALYEEPEAVYDLVGAVTDYKIALMKACDKTFHLDYWTYSDDYAYADGLLMSPELFRKIFKPHIARMVEACNKETSMIFKMHCCGKMETLVDDFLDIGVTAFEPVQPVNNIPEILNKTVGKAGIMGGLNIQHIIDRADVTEEEIYAEVKRCIDIYDIYGAGYMIYGASVHSSNPVQHAPGGRIFAIKAACEKYGRYCK